MMILINLFMFFSLLSCSNISNINRSIATDTIVTTNICTTYIEKFFHKNGIIDFEGDLPNAYFNKYLNAAFLKVLDHKNNLFLIKVKTIKARPTKIYMDWGGTANELFEGQDSQLIYKFIDILQSKGITEIYIISDGASTDAIAAHFLSLHPPYNKFLKRVIQSNSSIRVPNGIELVDQISNTATADISLTNLNKYKYIHEKLRKSQETVILIDDTGKNLQNYNDQIISVGIFGKSQTDREEAIGNTPASYYMSSIKNLKAFQKLLESIISK